MLYFISMYYIRHNGCRLYIGFRCHCLPIHWPVPALGCSVVTATTVMTSLRSLLSAVVPIWRIGVPVPDRLVIIDKDLCHVALRAAARRGTAAGRRGGVGGQRNAHLSVMPWRLPVGRAWPAGVVHPARIYASQSACRTHVVRICACTDKIR